MAKKKGSSRKNAKGEDERERKRFIAGGAVLVAVAAVLILGAVLQSGPETEPVLPDEQYMGLVEPEAVPAEMPPRPESEPPAATPMPPRNDAPPPAAPSAPRAGSLDLARRAAEDRTRLAASGPQWTLQFVSLCDPANARSLLESLGASQELHVIRAGDCYRFCWGRYANRDRAVARRDAVARATGVAGPATPKRIEEALR
jgi:hypothetical protein